MEPTPPEVQRLALDEDNPQMITTEEQSVPTPVEIYLVTKQADKTLPINTLEEQRDLFKLVLGINFDGVEINSSQDFEVFIGLQVLTYSLHDVVMSEIEELVDYEDSRKDNQHQIDGSGEGNLPTDELENISGNPTKPLVTTTEVSNIGGEILAVSEPSSFIDVGMPKAHNPSKDNKPQDRIADEVSKPMVTSTDNVLTTSSAPPIEKGNNTIDRESIMEVTQEENLIQEEVMVNINHPKSIINPIMEKLIDDDHP